MSQSPYAAGVSPVRDMDVLAKTRDVLAYQRNPEQEGRPVLLLMGGAAVALVCVVLIAMLAFRTFYEHRLDPDQAYFGISLLFCFYVLGVFLFCYGYELYDMPRALRLTLIAAVLSVVFLVLAIVALSALAKMKDGVAALAEKSDSVSDGSLARTLFSYAGVNAGSEAKEEARRRRGGFEDFITPDARPFLVKCQACSQMYSPSPPRATCPNCGQDALAG